MGTSPDKSLIFVIGFPADINVVASSTFQTYRRFQNTGNWVNSVDIDKDNQFVAAGLTDSLQNSGKVRIWRLSDGSLFKEWKKPEPVHTVKFSPDGSFLATDGDTGSIQFLDFREDRTLRTVPGYSPIAFSTPSSEEPQTLIAARASQRQVQVWNMSGSVWGGVDLGANVNNVSNLKFFRKGRPLLVVFDNSIVLADIYGSYPPRKYPGTLCEITADDQFMVGSSNYGLFVICVSSWSVTSIVPSEFPYQMALLSDGRVLFSEDQGLKQYYLQNRWTSPLVDPNAGWMPNRTTLLRGSRSHR